MYFVPTAPCPAHPSRHNGTEKQVRRAAKAERRERRSRHADIVCSHGLGSNFGHERMTNPFLTGETG